MTFLLDTHIWIWSLENPSRLSRQARSLLHDPRNTLALSPISVWEALLLARKGRLIFKPNPWDRIRDAVSVQSLRQLPVTFDIAMASRRIRLPHQDPADRFIAATAQVHRMVLVTADRMLLACPDIRAIRGG